MLKTKRIRNLSNLVLVFSLMFFSVCRKKDVPPMAPEEIQESDIVSLRDTSLPVLLHYGTWGHSGLNIDGDTAKDIYFNFFQEILAYSGSSESSISMAMDYWLQLKDTLVTNCFGKKSRIRWYKSGDTVLLKDTVHLSQNAVLYNNKHVGGYSNPNPTYCSYEDNPPDGGYLVIRKIVGDKITIGWIQYSDKKLHAYRKFKAEEKMVLP